MMDFPIGNELPTYVAAKFQELQKRRWNKRILDAVGASGCDVEDHQRGLRSWANVGGHLIEVPTKGSDPQVADYYALRERSLSALDEQIEDLANALSGEIERHLAAST